MGGYELINIQHLKHYREISVCRATCDACKDVHFTTDCLIDCGAPQRTECGVRRLLKAIRDRPDIWRDNDRLYAWQDDIPF